MELKVETNVEVTLKMSGEDFKKMMNGLNKFSCDRDASQQEKIDAGDVWIKMKNMPDYKKIEW